MDIRDLKERIYDDDKIIDILEYIGMHKIKTHNEYISCAWKDGDNPNGCTIYKNEYLTVVPYTRKISKNQNITPDIITLVQFTEDLKLFDAIKFICNIIGIDIYDDLNKELPMGLAFMKELHSLSMNDEEEDDVKLKVIDEHILSYYKSYVNDLFEYDNISYITQQEFEIGYDDCSNMITIPIRDEYGMLVGVKGRLFKDVLEDSDTKYIYLEKVPRNKLLYGLNKTYDSIVQQGFVYICESEKGVMQLWSMGYCNAIATGGSHLGREQIEKITRLGVKIVFVFDKDIKKNRNELSKEEVYKNIITLEDIVERFIDGIKIYAIVDTINILNKNESPTDTVEKWERLNSECLYQIK